ncbi:hypothetical protein LNP74_05825 [Klebsiella pneumoniae subsp. pneumoniae]|nr:hypothetical protein [Klebsiella pneumoniae subsp. pneumoniae]
MFPAPADKPLTLIPPRKRRAGSPRQRDKPARLGFVDSADPVFPRASGINRNIDKFDEVTGSVPRASGDKPSKYQRRTVFFACSPRQRNKPVAGAASTVTEVCSPAPAE